ncbi:TadE/TadG family type IV pilus assembly protein [Vibrio sp. TRT 17S01]|uniref:TadE/TadG family type IV pilus assembly protein n=1 Tax=Vibrio sp. TRT 17S01 TaxID=3418505 RepID=UPI003CE7709A
MQRQQGSYSVEFVLTFLILFSTIFLAIEVGRFTLTSSIVDLRFRELVYESRTLHSPPLSKLKEKYFSQQQFIDGEDVSLTSKACETMVHYLANMCSFGKGVPQHIVEYSLVYEYQPIIPLLQGSGKGLWQHESVMVVRNEPDFEVSKW